MNYRCINEIHISNKIVFFRSLSLLKLWIRKQSNWLHTLRVTKAPDRQILPACRTTMTQSVTRTRMGHCNIKAWENWPSSCRHFEWHFSDEKFCILIQTEDQLNNKPTLQQMVDSLQWRHNDRLNGVSNHQPHDCLLNRLFRHRSKKTSKLLVTGLWAGNSPVTGEFPAQRANNTEYVSIWWRHHVVQNSQAPSHYLSNAYLVPELDLWEQLANRKTV